MAELIAGTSNVPAEIGSALEHPRVEGKPAFVLPATVAAALDTADPRRRFSRGLRGSPGLHAV